MKKQSIVKQFFIFFVIGIFMLSLPFSYALVKFSSPAVEELPLKAYEPSYADSTTIAFSIASEKTDPPHCVLLLRLVPAQKQVILSAIPPELMVEGANGFDSLLGVYKKEGASKGILALEKVFNIDISYYFSLSKEEIITLGEMIGAIDFNVEQPLYMNNGISLISSGRQLITGRKATQLIEYKSYALGEKQRLELIATLTRELLFQRAYLISNNTLSQLYKNVVNSGENNMSIEDFENMRQTILYMLSPEITVDVIPVNGEYNSAGNTFLPATQSISEIEYFFS